MFFRRASRCALLLLAATLAGVAPGAAQPPRLDPALETALNAVRDGEFEAMQAAFDGGLEVDAKAPNGMTALHVAAVLGREEFVTFLIERGADVTDPAQNGITPLHRASLGGHLGTMRLLLEAGAAVDAAATWGATPLMSAVDRGHLEAARLLLGAGADPTAAATNGETALSLARSRGRQDLIRLLSEDPDTVSAEREAESDRRASRTDTHLRTGVAFDDAGEVRRAIESYRLALEQDPAHPEVRYRLGRALHRFGEREALLHFLEAVRGWAAMVEEGEDLPNFARPALEDACTVLTEENPPDAATLCDRALHRSPELRRGPRRILEPDHTTLVEFT